MRDFFKMVVAASIAGCFFTASAQPFPSKPITLEAPFAAGGPVDQMARLVAKHLADELGEKVIVSNRAGGGGGIGAAHVARASPDGHALLLALNATQVMAPILTPVGYDGLKDFQYLGSLSRVSNVLVINPAVKANTLQDLIALAKAKPGALNYGSTGVGGGAHMPVELLKQRLKIHLTHIPYRGATPAITDLIAGQVQVAFLNISAVLPFIRSGQLKPLAIAAGTRSRLLPEVPTFAEAGVPAFEAASWYAIAAPKNIPRPVAERLAAAIEAVRKNKEFQNTLMDQGAEAWSLNAEQMTKFVESDMRTTLELIKSANLKLD